MTRDSRKSPAALSQRQGQTQFGLCQSPRLLPTQLGFHPADGSEPDPGPEDCLLPLRREQTALRGAGLGEPDLAFTAQCRHLIWVSRPDGLQDQAMRPHPPPVPKTSVKGLTTAGRYWSLFSARIPPGVLLRLPLPVTRRCGTALHESSNWSQRRAWG